MEETSSSSGPIVSVAEPAHRSLPSLPQKPPRFVWQGKIAPAFWTFASAISLTVNLVLLVILIIVGKELFTIKSLVSDQLIAGLYSNFQKMDAAHIKTSIRVQDTILVQDTITVNDTIPVVFDLPLNQETVVTLTKNTPINGATVYLNGSPVPANIVLPKNTELKIALNLVVPVNQMLPVTLNVPVNLEVPVDMQVPVDIPLEQTELHEPFVGLQGVVYPYNQLLSSLPSSWEETPVCGPNGGLLCTWLFEAK